MLFIHVSSNCSDLVVYCLITPSFDSFASWWSCHWTCFLTSKIIMMLIFCIVVGCNSVYFMCVLLIIINCGVVEYWFLHVHRYFEYFYGLDIWEEKNGMALIEINMKHEIEIWNDTRRLIVEALECVPLPHSTSAIPSRRN